MTSPSGTFGLYESRVIQVRCAGSTDNNRFRTSTCPSEDCGIDVSFQRNSSPVNLPAGRTFKIHWRFLLLVIECPHSLTDCQLPSHLYFGKVFPNMGAPLFDCSSVASSWITSQCSTRIPSLIRTMSAEIQFNGSPKPENRPCTITKSPSATIVPASYFRVGGILLIRSNSPSRPGAM